MRLIRALTDLGHVVTSAAAGMDALKAVIDQRPDLMVLDLGLPDVDGEDLLRMVRAVSQVPIVVVTARGDEAVIVRVLERGADDYVIKPFGAAQLDAQGTGRAAAHRDRRRRGRGSRGHRRTAH